MSRLASDEKGINWSAVDGQLRRFAALFRMRKGNHVKVAIVLSGVAPAMTLMSGAMLEFADRDIEFDTISTSGVGALIGMLYLAPSGKRSPQEALRALPNLFISDPLSRVLPVNFKVFDKKGPFTEPFNELGKLIPRMPVDPRKSEPGKRLYNDLIDLWVTALTPSTLSGKSKGLMTPLPLVDDLVDFDRLKNTKGEFYLNAFNAATRRLKIFTKQELDAKIYAAGQAMGFLYAPEQFGKDVYTIGATHDPTGLQALWMHPDKESRPDIIICLDSMRYAYWRKPTNLYDSFQLMLLNPIVALQRNIYALYASTEWLYNQNLAKFEEDGVSRPRMPKLYRVPMEGVVKQERYSKLLDWSHSSALEFEGAGRTAAAPVAEALAQALKTGDTEGLEAYRFRTCPSFDRQYGAWHAGTDPDGGHRHGLVAGLERTLAQVIKAGPAADQSQGKP